ncbi:amidohydrolase family protein [Sphingomonas changnyeongensis]|uniref:Amidohydrolase family protein n=1 Tax=Sphingomonas changnyeongensis TaxID=2698679 RepID=A0A7Z2NWH1_9SPHN|nr:amidohydrolase family protein [Sphingomonas changnyeongensis]QHL91113.1 amidohydrolase family protein [Sphingomonas changnyeongensis]
MKALLMLGAALAAAVPAGAETIAIVGGRVALGDGSAPIDTGTVILRDGRIVAAGAAVAVPAGARVIDARGKWVAPGFVAGFTRLGLVEVDAVDDTNDTAARGSPYSAAIDIEPGINPRVSAIAVSRAGGVTRAVVAPETANEIFAGQGAVIDTGDDMDAVTVPRAFQFVELGEAGAREAGGSRPAAILEFRTKLRAAQAYARNPAGYGGDSKDALLPAADAAALVAVVDGRVPLLVHVESASDILTVLRLKREFAALRLVLVGASEGWMVAREIAAARVPVLASALNDLPASFEMLAATQSNIGRLRAAGVTVGIGMIDDNEARQARYVAQYAGNLVALSRIPGAGGMSWGDALAAITSAPAEALGLGGEIGSLRPGRRADVVLWSGDPLELQSKAERVWIDGVEQPLGTRQTRLRDRYLQPQEGDLPKAYQR